MVVGGGDSGSRARVMVRCSRGKSGPSDNKGHELVVKVMEPPNGLVLERSVSVSFRCCKVSARCVVRSLINVFG